MRYDRNAEHFGCRGHFSDAGYPQVQTFGIDDIEHTVPENNLERFGCRVELSPRNGDINHAVELRKPLEIVALEGFFDPVTAQLLQCEGTL